MLQQDGERLHERKAISTTLARRLAVHYRKRIGRQSIDLADVSCRFLTIHGYWFVRAAEDALIQHYAPLWQNSGFGSHVPGRGRPGIKKSRWDTLYPLKSG